MNSSGPYRIKRLYLQKGVLESPLHLWWNMYRFRNGKDLCPTHTFGALAVVDILKYPSFLRNRAGYTCIGRIRPGTFGTILRLADWFNIEAVYASCDCVELQSQDRSIYHGCDPVCPGPLHAACTTVGNLYAPCLRDRSAGRNGHQYDSFPRKVSSFWEMNRKASRRSPNISPPDCLSLLTVKVRIIERRLPQQSSVQLL